MQSENINQSPSLKQGLKTLTLTPFFDQYKSKSKCKTGIKQSLHTSRIMSVLSITILIAYFIFMVMQGAQR